MSKPNKIKATGFFKTSFIKAEDWAVIAIIELKLNSIMAKSIARITK